MKLHSGVVSRTKLTHSVATVGETGRHATIASG